MQDSEQKNREHVRTVIDPKVMSPHANDKILIPICDYGWTPAFRRGELAVVDTRNRELEDGALVCVRGESGHFSLTELRLWDEDRMGRIMSKKKWKRPFWSMLYGKQRMQSWTPAGQPTFVGEPIRIADGPADTELMRSKIIGRVIGVLGTKPQALNWGA